MYVRVIERPDQWTILCQVVWSQGGFRLSITVPVKATLDEFSAPLRFGDDFVMHNVPVLVPERIQNDAMEAAKAVAKSFLEGASRAKRP